MSSEDPCEDGHSCRWVDREDYEALVCTRCGATENIRPKQ